MKKMKKLPAVLLVVVGLMTSLIGCEEIVEDADLFKEKGDGKLLTSNLSAEDMVLFWDIVRPANLLGGLPANARNHRIKLPESNKLGVVYAVKYSDYKGKPANEIQNIRVLDSSLVYSDPLYDTSCDIGDPKLGGTAQITFTNQTNYFIEVGESSAGNEDLFYVMRPNSTKDVFVQPKQAGYRLYMTLNLPMKKSGKIIGVQRRFIDEWTKLIVPQTGIVETVTIDRAEVTGLAPSYREGYLRIINNGGRGYSVINGSQAITSTIGFSAISDGSEQVWELLGDAYVNDETPGRVYGSFKLEAPQATNNLTVSSFNIWSGYKYTMIIHPDGTNPKVTISAGTPLDPDEEEIIW